MNIIHIFSNYFMIQAWNNDQTEMKNIKQRTIAISIWLWYNSNRKERWRSFVNRTYRHWATPLFPLSQWRTNTALRKWTRNAPQRPVPPCRRPKNQKWRNRNRSTLKNCAWSGCRRPYWLAYSVSWHVSAPPFHTLMRPDAMAHTKFLSNSNGLGVGIRSLKASQNFSNDKFGYYLLCLGLLENPRGL